MGDEWKEDDFDWKESVYKFRKMGFPVHYFTGFDIQVDLKNNTRHIISVKIPYNK